MSSAAVIVVTTTTSTPEEGQRIAELLVTKRLAACVQATPIRSTYMWQGKLASHEETLLSIKTLQSAYPKVQSLIREAHSYDTPEIIAQPVTGVSMSYFDWVASQVDPD